jgi:hypothetical protein
VEGEEVDTVVMGVNRVVRGADWLEETDFTQAEPRSVWLKYITVPEEVLLFPEKF